MKHVSLALFTRAGLLGLLFFIAGCATTQTPPVPGTLHVKVNVPPSWNMLVEDRISEAFVDEVRDVFYRGGFNRPVEEMRFVDPAANAPYLLTVNLTEWRISPIGNVECTFVADLQTPDGNKRLGVYNNTEMRGFGGGFGRFGLARSFEDAAEGAIRDLWRDLAKSDMLPPLRGRVAQVRSATRL